MNPLLCLKSLIINCQHFEHPHPHGPQVGVLGFPGLLHPGFPGLLHPGFPGLLPHEGVTGRLQ